MHADTELDQRKTILRGGDNRQTLILPDRARCQLCRSRITADARFCGMCGQPLQRTALVGAIIDQLYLVEEQIAEGGFATIYRGRYLPTGLEVALKVLHPELASDEHSVTRFRREGRRMLRLRNPHTVSTYDYGETSDGTHYIVMELLRGETLAERLAAVGPLPWREVLHVMRAVCSSLVEAHAHGIVHRDLKPANIFLGHDLVKLLDFGLAKVYSEDEDLTRVGQTAGTLQYMAPEQLVGPACDGRTDLYALGVVGYEMLTGRRPFGDAATVDQLVTALLTQAAPAASTLRSRRDVPLEVDRLLARCLERESDARFATVTELVVEIDHILAIPIANPRRACIYPLTCAFELDPPRIVAAESPSPAFVSGESELGRTEASSPAPLIRFASLVWLLSFLVGGVGVGTVVARLV